MGEQKFMRRPGFWMWCSGVAVLLAVCIGLAMVSGSLPAWRAVGWHGETLPTGVRKGVVQGEYLHETDQAIMVYVPAGAFLRGTSAAQVQALTAQFGDYFAVETPQRSIYVSAYYIDKFEVTNQQYAQFLAALAAHGPRYVHPSAPPRKDPTPTYWRDRRLNGATQPVTGVDWYDAYAYCRWAGRRLLTEAQWEKAARGPTGQEYPWGNAWSAAYSNNAESTFGSAILSHTQWIRLLAPLRLETLHRLTMPVGSFPEGASPYGAHDMGGNLWEWCQDSYRKDYYRYATSRDPAGPPPSPYKVLRGGCWSSDRGKIRAAYRNYDLATDRHLEVGFRCAR
jgi:formylglycine-generating enzyme required for sulfatase activity